MTERLLAVRQELCLAVQSTAPRQGIHPHRKDDLDDGAVEELLFGWLEGWAES